MYKRILFIEDQKDIAEIYATILGLSGYEVTLKYDGEEGLLEAQTNPYDLILLDLMLPFLPGIEVLKTLRDKAKSPNFNQATDIVVLTNFDVNDILKQEILSLAKSYLIKVEITPRILVDILADMDRQKQAAAAPPASAAPAPPPPASS